VAEISQCGAEHAAILAVEEQGADFGFRSGADDDSHDVAVHVECAISRWGSGRGGWLTCALAEEEQAASAGSHFGFGEVGCVAVDVEDHVAGAETDCCVG
jgi:hypothetical protein